MRGGLGFRAGTPTANRTHHLARAHVTWRRVLTLTQKSSCPTFRSKTVSVQAKQSARPAIGIPGWEPLCSGLWPQYEKPYLQPATDPSPAAMSDRLPRLRMSAAASQPPSRTQSSSDQSDSSSTHFQAQLTEPNLPSPGEHSTHHFQHHEWPCVGPSACHRCSPQPGAYNRLTASPTKSESLVL